MKLPKNFQTIIEPFDYQKETILYGIKNPKSGLILPVGRGKTMVSINIARYRIQNNDVKKVLVLAPVTLLYNWKKEIEKFSEYKAIVLHNPIRQNRVGLINYFKENDNFHFGMTNYETLLHFYEELSQLNIDMVIADESSRYIKNYGAKRTKFAIKLFNTVPYKHIVTATLIPNNPIDIWSQFMFMDEGITLGINFYAFRNYFFKRIKIGAFNKFKLKNEKKIELSNSIKSSCIILSNDDIKNDLPDIIRHTIDIKFDDKSEDTYEEMENRIITEIETELDNVSVNIDNALIKLLKLQQFTSGFFSEHKQSLHKQDTEKFGVCKIKKMKKKGTNVLRVEKKLVATPKLDSLTEHIDSIVESGESVIIWCRFLFSIDMICEVLKKLGIKNVKMTGETKDPYSVWKGFQNSKTKNVFIGQIVSGGIGIELFKKEDVSKGTYQHMIFYENLWTPDVREQAEGRIARIGQTKLMRYVDLVVPKTIDEKIIKAINDKQKVVDSIMKDGIRNFLRR